jgi:hypothetical protein
MQNLTVQVRESKQLVVLALQLLLMRVLEHHHLNHQSIVVVNKEMLVFQVLNQLKVLLLVLISQHRMNQLHFQLKVVILHLVEPHPVVQVHQDMKILALQLLVLTVKRPIRLLLHFMPQI